MKLAPWKRVSLWARIVVAVTVAFLALFAVFAALSLRAVDASTQQIVRERLVITEMGATEIDRVLERTLAELRAARSSSVLQMQGAPAVEVRRLLASVRSGLSPIALRVDLLDRHGRAIAVAPRSPGAKVPPAVRRAGRAAVAGSKAGFSAPYRDASGRPAVAVALDAGDGTGSALVAVLDASARDFVSPLLAARRLGLTGHALLIGTGGLVVASTEPEEVLHLGEHPAFYRTMLARPHPAVETVAYVPWDAPATARPGERHVMTWVPLHEAPWGVSVGGSAGETFAPASHLRRLLLFGGSGALIGLWLAALVGARLLVRPVYALTRSARAMAGGDLEQPVEVDEGGEIGILGESLEAMRVQLRGSLETIQRWGESLEATVEDRTRELLVRNRQLGAVTAAATAANQSRDLAGVIDACLAVILTHTDMDGGAVRLADAQTGGLQAPFERDASLALSCGDRAVAGGGCACARVAAAREPLYLEPGQAAACMESSRAGAVTILPLTTGEGVLGVLTLARERGDVPDADERRMLTAIADQLAVAIENAQHVEELGRIDAQRKIQQLRTQLVSMVSHELRTPLGFIQSYATTLLHDRSTIDDDTQQQFLEIIDEETGKLERMIEELLDTSRLHEGSLPIDAGRVDVAALVRHVASKDRHGLQPGNIVVRVPDGEVAVMADALRLEQVLANLLDNAAWHGGSMLPIEVEVIAEDGRVLISVCDHGRGIPAREQESIFEPFFRGSAPSRPNRRSVGLGLAICKGLVEAHGGTIWVESEEGRGATFVVSLPLLATGDDTPSGPGPV